jgi:hypothetical protein
LRLKLNVKATSMHLSFCVVHSAPTGAEIDQRLTTLRSLVSAP